MNYDLWRVNILQIYKMNLKIKRIENNLLLFGNYYFKLFPPTTATISPFGGFPS